MRNDLLNPHPPSFPRRRKDALTMISVVSTSPLSFGEGKQGWGLTAAACSATQLGFADSQWMWAFSHALTTDQYYA